MGSIAYHTYLCFDSGLPNLRILLLPRCVAGKMGGVGCVGFFGIGGLRMYLLDRRPLPPYLSIIPWGESNIGLPSHK